MPTPISLFDYYLPPELIAQHSVEPRDRSRLLVLSREKKTDPSTGLGAFGGRNTINIEHRNFFEIIDYLKPGDVLVMNDTKVFKARLRGLVKGKKIEVFLLRVDGEKENKTVWQALLKPGRSVEVGDSIILADDIKTVVCEKKDDGVVLLDFKIFPEEVLSFVDKYGEVSVPPYVKQIPDKAENYQTVYARELGSVAAPTAGFHFTEELLNKIKDKGIEILFITLHVGLGTFRPVKSETLEEHQMHSEFVEIKPNVAQAINKAKQEGRRIIAVGTTTTRALEGTALNPNFSTHYSLLSTNYPLPNNGFLGEVNIFITPGFQFKVIDALITNFHLPKSTLLVLVSALAGRENILAAYKKAVEQGYRFYSFGDAMFIV